MLILDGTIGSDIHAFLARLQEESIPCSIMLYEDWLITHHACSAGNHGHHDHDQPEGIIYLRVLPEIADARLRRRALPSEASITLDYIQQIYTEKEQLFIENKNNLKAFEHLPVLVLNGNIDFQTDFSQFYNHLFYIRRFINEINKRREIALGTYKEKIPHRHCC